MHSGQTRSAPARPTPSPWTARGSGSGLPSLRGSCGRRVRPPPSPPAPSVTSPSLCPVFLVRKTHASLSPSLARAQGSARGPDKPGFSINAPWQISVPRFLLCQISPIMTLRDLQKLLTQSCSINTLTAPLPPPRRHLAALLGAPGHGHTCHHGNGKEPVIRPCKELQPIYLPAHF